MPPVSPTTGFDAISPTHRATNPASVHPSGVTSPRPDVATRWDFGKLTLGGVIAGVFIVYYTLLETTCTNTDPYEGAGELVITQGGSAKGTEAGTRFPAPVFVNAGEQLTANGTADAELLWIENLCDDVLDQSTCPLELNSRFNASALREKILLSDVTACEELFMCGYNRLGRTFGHTGLVGLGQASLDAAETDTPGGFRSPTGSESTVTPSRATMTMGFPSPISMSGRMRLHTSSSSQGSRSAQRPARCLRPQRRTRGEK